MQRLAVLLGLASLLRRLFVSTCLLLLKMLMMLMIKWSQGKGGPGSEWQLASRERHSTERHTRGGGERERAWQARESRESERVSRVDASVATRVHGTRESEGRAGERARERGTGAGERERERSEGRAGEDRRQESQGAE